MSQLALFSGAPNKPKIRIEQYGNDYAVFTPYSAQFIELLKRHVPPQHRSFTKDNGTAAWIIHPASISLAADQVENAFGERPEVPTLTKTEEIKFTFQLDYVGIPKLRDGQAEKTALGLSKGQWRVIFSEVTLKSWFEKEAKNSSESSLFSLLLIPESANDQEIKSAYKRMARQWHPDVCHEENAQEKFLEIGRAYEILIDPQKRTRYEAGLFFERSQQSMMDTYFRRNSDLFIPPLRCGNLVVLGSITVGRLRVSEILEWSDVVNDQGQTMVSSWNKLTEKVQIEWV